MVFQKLFLPKGGGSVRRWTRFQQQLIRKSLDSEHILKGPITLFDFANYDDAYDAALVSEGSKQGGWRISDDGVIGGFSRSQLILVRSKEDHEQLRNGGELKGSLLDLPRPDNIKPDLERSPTPFIRWHGNLDTRIGENSRAHRSGFCAIRSPQFPLGGADLAQKYNALEFLCRSDGRSYTVNLKVTTFFPDDLYQHVIQIEPTLADDFARVVLPFRHFLHTSVGRVREVQRILDGAIQVETIGLTLMDGNEGDFQFDLARIRAVNYFDGQILGEDDEDAPY